MITRIPVVLALLLLPAGARAALPENSNPVKLLDQPLARDAMGVTLHRLSNGLTVYLSPNDQEPRVSARLSVRAGAAHDPDNSTGMAHYLEHMLFKGSRKLGTLDYPKEKAHLERMRALYEDLFAAKDKTQRESIYAQIDAENQKAAVYAIPNEMDKVYKQLGIGGVNAFTSKERTVYVCDLPKNRLRAWAKLEGDRFAQPIFRLFQSEIETVYEEKNLSLDNAGEILSEAIEQNLFKSHPYSRPILGSIEHLKNPSLAKMYAFYERYYVPNNMSVALAGDFDRNEVLGVLEEYLGGWQPRALPPRPRRIIPPLQGNERIEVKYEAEEQATLVWRTVPGDHPDRYALRVMDMVFDNANSGIVNLRLNQAQKVKSAGTYGDNRNEGGSWAMWVLPKEGQTLEEAEALLLGTIDAVKKGEFDEEDLKAIILAFEIGEKGGLESNENRVSKMSSAFTDYEEWDDTVDYLQRLRAVTKADVVRVAKKYLGEDRLTAFRRKAKPDVPSIEKPSFTKVKIDAARQSDFFQELIGMPAETITPKWIEIGRDYTLREIPAGRLYVVKNPMNDLFSLGYQFQRGMLHSRKLCAALGLLDLSGAGGISAEEFKRKLYSLGLNLETSCDKETSGVGLSGLEEHLEEGLALMRLRFEKPVFKSDDLKKMVEIWVGQHKDNKVDPDYINYALGELVSRGGESAVLAQLTDDELRALAEDELKTLIHGFFDYKGRISYVGLRSGEQVAGLLEVPGKTYLEAPAHKKIEYLKSWKTRVVFVHRDMVQSKVGFYASDEIFDPKNYADYRFYSGYMGDGMSSVVFQEVREARALAYSAYGGYSSADHTGDENTVMGYLGTQADKTIEATKLLVSLVKNLPPSQERFLETQKSILEGFRTNPIKFREIAGAIMYWEDLGIEGDPREWRMKEAAAYTLEKLVRFAQRFREKNMSIYILGHRERVDLKALEAMGAFSEKTISDLFPY